MKQFGYICGFLLVTLTIGVIGEYLFVGHLVGVINRLDAEAQLHKQELPKRSMAKEAR